MRKNLYRVSLMTEGGTPVADTIAAYDADDAKRLARSMMRANHGESYCTVTGVTQVG